MNASDIYEYLQKKYTGDELEPSESDSDLVPDNLTAEQKKRDKLTTVLYRQYVSAHNEKSSFTRKVRKAIFVFCIIWVSIFVLTCLCLSVFIIVKGDNETKDYIALVSAVVPLVVAILGILHVVSAYVFPADEDKNTTAIVEKIHDNDLKNKLENMKSKKPELEQTGNLEL